MKKLKKAGAGGRVRAREGKKRGKERRREGRGGGPLVSGTRDLQAFNFRLGSS